MAQRPYLRELSVDELTAALETFTGRTGLRDAVAISQEKIETLADFWPLAGFLFDGPVDDAKAREKWLDADHRHALVQAREALAHVEPFDGRADRARAARGRRGRPGAQAQGRLPADPRRAGRHDDLARASSSRSTVLGRDESLRRLDAALATS